MEILVLIASMTACQAMALAVAAALLRLVLRCAFGREIAPAIRAKASR